MSKKTVSQKELVDQEIKDVTPTEEVDVQYVQESTVKPTVDLAPAEEKPEKVGLLQKAIDAVEPHKPVIKTVGKVVVGAFGLAGLYLLAKVLLGGESEELDDEILEGEFTESDTDYDYSEEE